MVTVVGGAVVVVVAGTVGTGLVVEVGDDVVGPGEVAGVEGCVVVTTGLVAGGLCVVVEELTPLGAGLAGVVAGGTDTPMVKPATVVATGPTDSSEITVPSTDPR